MALRLRSAGLCAAALCASLWLHGDARTASTLHAQLTGVPPVIMLWAWEEPEDLRSLDPQRVGVAFLAERVFLGRSATVVPRRQRILIPHGAYAVAVVRLEASSQFEDSAALRQAAAYAVLRAAMLPGVRGAQVDFDATASQREFYEDVLQRVRKKLPAGRALTITALVSWCSSPEGWLSKLPVDTAVPMESRLGKHAGEWRIEDPLCRGSIGISTDEPGTAQELKPGTRVYLFATRPWTAEQLAVLNRDGLPGTARGGR